MKGFTGLMATACLLCAAPLAQACGGMHHGGGYSVDIFKEMDKNGDGKVSKNEFDAYHRAYFKEMDSNHDGNISRAEMDAVHGKLADKCDTAFGRRFDEVDINGDGRLSKDEAEIGMPMIFAHFDEFDANRDGKLSKDEIAAGMLDLHKHMPARPAETIKPEKP